MSTQVTYEIDHVSLFLDLTISSALIFCFYVFYRYLKDHVKRNVNSQRRNNYLGNHYNYFGLPNNFELVGPV